MSTARLSDDDTEALVAEIALLERAIQVVASPPAPRIDPTLALVVDRTLDGLEQAIERAGRIGKPHGNTHHDAQGHFTDAGHEGHAIHKPREGRKPRRHRSAQKTTTSGRKGIDTRVKLTKADAPRIKDHARAERARLTEKRSAANVQRYAEHVEGQLIARIGGTQGTDNGALDVVRRMRGRELGIEVKTIVNKGGPNKSGKKAQIKCEKDQKARKEAWKEMRPNRELHTVVFDHRDRAIDLDTGEHIGNRDAYSGHDLYYRRGVGEYTLGGMHPVQSTEELKRLMAMPDSELPAKAQAAKPKPKPKAKPKAPAKGKEKAT